MRDTIVGLLVLGAAATASARTDEHVGTLEVRSSAFPNQGSIPSEFTCQGASVSPPLSWAGVPKATQSIAILVEDPDAPRGTFTHWLITGLPASARALDRDPVLPAGAVVSRNDAGSIGFTAPCPPSGTHHYHFQVFALDDRLPLPMTTARFKTEIQGHVLAVGELVGTVSHQPG